MRAFPACALLLAACAAPGVAGSRASSPSSAAGTSAAGGERAAVAGPLVTAGTRCPAGACACRAIDTYGRSTGPAGFDEGAPAEGQKRFELRTGRGYEALTISVAGHGTLTKTGETVEPVCGYLDLPPGEHRVTIHARATKGEAEGMAPLVAIAEYAPETHDWYDAFGWRCGSDAPCRKVDLGEWMHRARIDHPRGIFDPCGSTRVQGIRWDIGHAADYIVEDLTLELTLKVYKFVPRAPHGGKCKGLPEAEE
jgi:hypothetical protein